MKCCDVKKNHYFIIVTGYPYRPSAKTGQADPQQNYYMQKVSHMSEVCKTSFLSVPASSEDEAAQAITHMQAARQGLHCFSWIKTVILLSEEGWLS